MIKLSKVEFHDDAVIVRYYKYGEVGREVALARELAIARTQNPELIKFIGEHVVRLILGAEEDLYDPDDSEEDDDGDDDDDD